MKVTKYPHRYSISLSEAEFAALVVLVARGRFSADLMVEQPARRILRTKRWASPEGPLTVDTVKGGRGGYAKVGED